jgi:hypothetical protein
MAMESKPDDETDDTDADGEAADGDDLWDEGPPLPVGGAAVVEEFNEEDFDDDFDDDFEEELEDDYQFEQEYDESDFGAGGSGDEDGATGGTEDVD